MLTIWSVWFAFAVSCPHPRAGVAHPGGWILVLSGLVDTIDGCVAVLTDRATRWGYVLDSAVDRINDVIYLFAVMSVGGPAVLALVAGSRSECLSTFAHGRATRAGATSLPLPSASARCG
jgi:phosphatidylglycerophosphate synthase